MGRRGKLQARFSGENNAKINLPAFTIAVELLGIFSYTKMVDVSEADFNHLLKVNHILREDPPTLYQHESGSFDIFRFLFIKLCGVGEGENSPTHM